MEYNLINKTDVIQISNISFSVKVAEYSIIIDDIRLNTKIYSASRKIWIDSFSNLNYEF